MLQAAWWSAGALLGAWALDLAFGEPRNAWHPVAWLGRALAPVGQALQALAPLAAFVSGACVWLLLALAVGLLAAGGDAVLRALPWWLGVPLSAVVLKPAFAWRMLREEVAAVDAALAQSLPAARERLARLVSRDVSGFDAPAVRETAIETLAENLNDSLVAPLFWFMVAGLPGAAIYRLANTMDAMWGYRGPWEWAGKWAARADDVLSWIPARITACLLMLGAPRADWRRLPRHARGTPSPNGGWPMAAMALRLHIRLGKPGVYCLNPLAPAPGAEALSRALARANRSAWLAWVVAMAFTLVCALGLPPSA